MRGTAVGLHSQLQQKVLCELEEYYKRIDEGMKDIP